MYKSILFIFCLFNIFTIETAKADVHIAISELSLTQQDIGTEVTVDVKVSGFLNIVSSQFSINWMPDVIQFNGVSNYQTLGLNPNENFGTNPEEINQGKMRFSWASLDVYSGVNLPDNTTIFSIRFLVTGAYGQHSYINVTDTPISIEIANADLVVLPVTIDEGLIAIGNVATYNVPDKNITSIKNVPNPFSDFTIIEFSLKSAESINLGIYDYTGRLVHTQNATGNPGLNTFRVNSSELPAPGIYSYRIEIPNLLISRKMIFF